MAKKHSNPFEVKKDIHHYAGHGATIDDGDIIQMLMEKLKALPIDHITSIEIPKNICKTRVKADAMARRAKNIINKIPEYRGFKISTKTVYNENNRYIFTRVFRVS